MKNRILKHLVILGKEIEISLPKRDNRTALFKDVLAGISQMDDKSLSKLINTVISRLNQDDKLHDIDARKMLLALHLLRTNPDKVKDYIVVEKNDYFESDTYDDCTFVGGWYPGCFLQKLYLFILWILMSLAALLVLYITSNIPTCSLYATCVYTCQEPSFCLVGCGIE